MHSASDVLWQHASVTSALAKINEVRSWVQEQTLSTVATHIDQLVQELAAGADRVAPSLVFVKQWEQKALAKTAELPTTESLNLGAMRLKVPGENGADDFSTSLGSAKELLNELVALARMDEGGLLSSTRSQSQRLRR